MPEQKSGLHIRKRQKKNHTKESGQHQNGSAITLHTDFVNVKKTLQPLGTSKDGPSSDEDSLEEISVSDISGPEIDSQSDHEISDLEEIDDDGVGASDESDQLQDNKDGQIKMGKSSGRFMEEMIDLGDQVDASDQSHQLDDDQDAENSAGEVLLSAGDQGEDAEWTMVQLQANDLVVSERLDCDKVGQKIRKIVSDLEAVVKSIPKQKVGREVAEGYLSDMEVPTELESMMFCPPESVSLSGFFPIKLFAKKMDHVEICVQMPKAIFNDQDFLNHKYHGKRLMYLVVLKNAISKNKKLVIKKMEFFPLGDDLRRPVLEMEMEGDVGIRFRLVPTISVKTFPVHRFRASQNNLRSVCKKDASNNVTLLPSPTYNMSVLEDMLMMTNNYLIHEKMDKMRTKPMVDALILLKIWLKKHYLLGSDGFSSSTWMLLMIHLMETQKINPSAASLRIFKAILQILVDPKTYYPTHLLPTPMSDVPKSEQKITELKNSFDVIFMDPSGWLNTAWAVTSSWTRLLQVTSKMACMVLNRVVASEEAFEALFENSLGNFVASDYCLKVHCPETSKGVLAFDRGLSRVQCRRVEELSIQALGDRARVVRVPPREVTSLNPSLGFSATIKIPLHVYVNADPEHAQRLIDKGPSPEDEEKSKKFRSFWGPKSEMRRFADSDLCEAISWNVPTGKRHTIPDGVLEHVLLRHLPKGTRIETFSGNLDAALCHSDADLTAQLSSLREIETVITDFSKALEELKSIALKIVAVHAVGPVVRHTQVFAPLPHPLAEKLHKNNERLSGRLARCLDPVDLLVELQTAAHWPMNASAYNKTKSALGTQLAIEINNNLDASATATEDYIDVLKSGYAFRLHVFSPRDEEMAEEGLVVHTVQHNVLHGFISAVGKTHPSFALAVRLAKRWIASQMFHPHINDVIIENLMVHVYSHKSCQTPPASPLTGFLRFLTLLSTFPWQTRPLIVDPASEFTKSDCEGIRKYFKDLRKSSLGRKNGMFVASPKDKSSACTKEGPNPIVVHRLAFKAKWALNVMKEFAASGDDANWMEVFHCKVSEFDVLIHLRKSALPSPHHAIKQPSLTSIRKRKCSEGSKDDAVYIDPASLPIITSFPSKLVSVAPAGKLRNQLLIGFDPVKHYVDELENRYGHVGVFCYDVCGGAVIGVKWLATAFEARKFNERSAHCCVPGKVEGKGLMVTPDVTSIVREFQDLGVGLVDSVQVL